MRALSTAAHAALTAHCVDRLGPCLRSLSLFGSQLWAGECDGELGIADLFAVLDDGTLADAAARCAARPWRPLLTHLPPLTLSLSLPTPGRGARQAKLNLIELSPLFAALQALPDLYLAGRWSKPMRLLYARDPACADEQRALMELAASQVSAWVLRGLQAPCSLLAVVRECAWLSYRGELRPEGPRRRQALFERSQAELVARFRPLILAGAPPLGLRYDPKSDSLFEARDAQQRRAQRLAQARLLWRSRLRCLLRWPKQMLVYRGWAAYVRDKLRRSQRAEEALCP